MKIGIIIIHARKHRASRYFLEVSKYFLKKHKLMLFTNRYDSLDKRIEIKKIPLPPFGFRIKEILFILFSGISVKLHKPDITMSQATRFFSPDIAYMQFVYKEWHKRTKTNSFLNNFLNNLVDWMESYNLKKAKKIIAMSNVVKNEIIRNHGIGNNKIKTIYSAADLDFFNPKHKKTYRSKIRKNLGFSDSDIVMIFVGNPFSRKGLEYLIKALPMINPAKGKTNGKIKLLVMGRDNKEFYIELAKKLNVSDSVVFGGFTPDINQYFSASDIFVFPTLYEPFGLVVLEAMASGLPVITSRIAGAAELIEDGKDGLLLDNPKDYKDIAKKVNYIIKNDLISKIGRNARKKAEKYTWERTALEMEKVFEDVVR